MLNVIRLPIRARREANVREQQQTTVWKLGELALNSGNLELLIDEVVIAVASTLEVELCGIFELLPDKASIELIAGKGWKKESVGRTVMLVGKESQEGSTLLQEKPVIIENYRDEKSFIAPALLREHDVLSGMTVIIHGSNGPFGVLGAYGTHHIHEFDESDLQFLQSVANILADVISRREVEDALGMSEEKYRTLFEECKDVVFVSTPEGDLIDINPAGVQLFEYKSKEEMMQINIQEQLFVNANDREEYQKVISGQGFVKDFQLTLKTKNERILFVEETSTAVRDAKNRVVAYRGIIRDVSKVRRLQQELLTAQRSESLEPLATHIAYDFLNVFTTISAYCELMRLKFTGDEPYDEYLRQMQNAIQKGVILTRELFSFSQTNNREK